MADAERVDGRDAELLPVELAYEETMDASWTGQAREFQRRGWLSATIDTTPQFLLKGKCPRCRHDLDQAKPEQVTADVPYLGSTADSVSTEEAAIVRLPTCECGQGHQGRPSNARHPGCGVTFSIYVERVR